MLQGSGCTSSTCLLPNVSASCPIKTVQLDGSIQETPCSGGSTMPFRDPILQQTGSGGCLCRGALREIHFTFRYDAHGRSSVALAAVEVRVVLQDLSTDRCQSASVLQSTSARFLPSSHLATLPGRSGNPGYQVGLPLLVTKCRPSDLEGSPKKCASFEDLILPAFVPGIRSDGSCDRKGNIASQQRIIRFGEDSIFGCTLALTRAELSNICKGGLSENSFVAELPLLSVGLEHWTHIAASGSVVPGSQDVADWVEVAVPGQTELLEFSDESAQAGTASVSTCRGAVIAVDVEVLYSPFGDVRQPQNHVVAARITHRLGQLTHTRHALQRQPFQFTFTVKFIQSDSTLEDTVVPPRPRVSIGLPHDLFYPFEMGGGYLGATMSPVIAAVLNFVVCELSAGI